MYLKDKEKTLRVRISKDQFEKLGKLAERANISVSDIIRQLIDMV